MMTIRRILGIGVAAVLLALSTGCASVNSTRAPDANVASLKTFYVVHQPKDSKGIEKMFATQLTALGHPATSGETETPPSPVDGVITYQDKWMWDITMYMIELDVQVREGKSGAILATARSFRPSLERKSPEAMVQEVLKEIFK